MELIVCTSARDPSPTGSIGPARPGILVPQEGVAFTMADGKATVALVGDSYTFG